MGKFIILPILTTIYICKLKFEISKQMKSALPLTKCRTIGQLKVLQEPVCLRWGVAPLRCSLSSATAKVWRKIGNSNFFGKNLRKIYVNEG